MTTSGHKKSVLSIFINGLASIIDSFIPDNQLSKIMINLILASSCQRKCNMPPFYELTFSIKPKVFCPKSEKHKVDLGLATKHY